eukprot:Amastigsp_a676523_397.p2 type:complete len:159 gc:universal Amastigsp_a676523_397:505-29(-)
MRVQWRTRVRLPQLYQSEKAISLHYRGRAAQLRAQGSWRRPRSAPRGRRLHRRACSQGDAPLEEARHCARVDPEQEVVAAPQGPRRAAGHKVHWAQTQARLLSALLRTSRERSSSSGRSDEAATAPLGSVWSGLDKAARGQNKQSLGCTRPRLSGSHV